MNLGRELTKGEDYPLFSQSFKRDNLVPSSEVEWRYSDKGTHTEPPTVMILSDGSTILPRAAVLVPTEIDGGHNATSLVDLHCYKKDGHKSDMIVRDVVTVSISMDSEQLTLKSVSNEDTSKAKEVTLPILQHGRKGEWFYTPKVGAHTTYIDFSEDPPTVLNPHTRYTVEHLRIES